MVWSAVIDMVTVYVLPIVFLKDEGIVAIPAGIAVFLRHWKRSLVLVGMIVAIFAVDVATSVEFVRLWSPRADIHTYAPLWVMDNMVVTQLSFLVFAGAMGMLVRQGERPAHRRLPGDL